MMDGPSYTRTCESCDLTAKTDLGGNQVIGWGHNSASIAPGTVWTQERADSQFSEDYADAQTAARVVVGRGFLGLDPVRQAALVDMCYELGSAGLAQFRHMLLAVNFKEWDAASEACLASTYAEQVPERAARTASMLLTGNWPKGYGG
jgi:GH24 family phage-related lysozyme (muramidase)